MSAAAPIAEINQGQRGEVNSTPVGVSWIAPDGASAEIVTTGTTDGTAWELRSDVRPDDLVPVGAALVPVLRIVPGSGSRGSVSFGAPAGQVPANTVMLALGGRLRVEGPSVLTATDVTVQAFQPGEQSPTSATLEWLPARYAKENTPPADIKQRTLHVGDTELIGRTAVTVVAIDPLAEHHPARLVLHLASKS